MFLNQRVFWDAMAADTTDDALANRALLQARNGVGAGFEFLFHELAGSISAFADRKGAEDPDGVANTALFDAYRALPTFEGDFDAFRGFVFRIARNRIIDDYRRRERRPKLAVLSEASPNPVWDRTDERLGADEWVADLLDQLTEEQREVIMLRVLADLSIEQTADLMDKPVTAIKALQRRAVRRLHKLTGEDIQL